jgi:hypothetical protein
MLRLYKAFTAERKTALVVGAPTAFASEEGWAADELRASDFGPVLRLEDIHDQVMAVATAAANGIGGVLGVDHSTAASDVANAAATAAAASEVELLPVANAAPIGAHAGEAPASGPGVLYGYARLEAG